MKASGAIEQLVQGELADPHSILGRHPRARKTTVRAWRPEAQSVSVLVEGETIGKLEMVHPAGLFEGTIDRDFDDYQLEVAYKHHTYTVRDPYSFGPTIGELDQHLIAEGTHRRLFEKLGAHLRTERGVDGVSFAVWAPNARSVRVVGDFNGWDGRLYPMRTMGATGIWEIFVPDIGTGATYKYEILTADGHLTLKADPYAFAAEIPPGTASRVFASTYEFGDETWLAKRASSHAYDAPLSVYEIHLGSWRHTADGRSLSYREAAPLLADYCKRLGFTHVEFLPLAEHPFGGSWGYQVTSYFAPTSRFGDPDELRFLVDTLHQNDVGVIVDWVPAHFPKDDWALAKFDGTALFEHLDPRLGEHPDWGTLIFNFGRKEVRNFLISNALYWIEDFHIDALRVDAVASMLYLDYSREEGEWVPNRFGGRENLEAIEFLKELNTVVHGEHPGVTMMAEESTAWPGVSRPTYLGGLGFGFKWNLGWMHDNLLYFSKDPIYRRYHHNQLTFSLMYAFSENFILPLSHDEVVHGKGSLVNKMPGDKWQRMANLRALYGLMWAHPGKQLLFMGGEIAQEQEWSHDRSLDWDLLDDDMHSGIQTLVADLNAAYRKSPTLWERDFDPEGFSWIDANDADSNALSFYRAGKKPGKYLVCVCNFAPVPRYGFRLGLPAGGTYREILNTDAAVYGGSNTGNMGAIEAEPTEWHGRRYSAELTLPPLGVIWLEN